MASTQEDFIKGLIGLMMGTKPSSLDEADHDEAHARDMMAKSIVIYEKAKASNLWGPVYEAIVSQLVVQNVKAFETNHLLREILSRLPNLADPSEEPDVRVLRVDLGDLFAQGEADKAATEPQDEANVPAQEG